MSGQLTRLGDSYFVVHPGDIVCEFQQVTEHRDGLTAELSVTHGGFLAHWGRLALASSVARATAAKAAGAAVPHPSWPRLIDEACHLVVRAARQGQPATPLEPKAPEPGRWLVDGLIPHGETSIVFGDGGAGKSLFALAFAVCALTGDPLATWAVQGVTRVLYLDWESSRRDHETRLWALLGPRAPLPPGSILYRPMTRPVAEDAGELRAIVARERVDLVICDSLGPACGAEPETAGAATQALNALRSCAPATRLVIAHVSKMEADRTRGASRPFGSVYVANLARSVIEARRTESAEEQEFTLTLTHTKSNAGPRRAQTALRWIFDPEGYIGVMKGQPDLARAPLPARILAQLRGGAQTVQALAEDLEVSGEAVRARLNELRTVQKVVRLTDFGGGKAKKNLWGLMDTNRTA